MVNFSWFSHKNKEIEQFILFHLDTSHKDNSQSFRKESLPKKKIQTKKDL